MTLDAKNKLPSLRPKHPLTTVAMVEEEMANAQGQAEAFYQLAETENRNLTDEEVQSVEQHLEYYQHLQDKEKPRVEVMEQMRRDAAHRYTQANASAARQAMETGSGFSQGVAAKPNVIHQQLRSFRADKFGGKLEAHRAAQDTGHWLRALMLQNKESIDYCRARPHLSFNLDERMDGQQVGDPTKGGYLVPEIVSQTILDVRDRYSLISGLARQYPMQGETDHLPKRVDGLTVYKPGEASQITSSDKTYGNVTLVANDAYTLTYISHKLMRGSVVDAADQVTNEIGYAFSRQIDMEGILGDGVAGPPYYGITGFIPGMGAGGQLTASGANWDAITTDDINKLISLLPDRFHGRNNTSGAPASQWTSPSEAVFICSRPFWAQVLEPLLEAGGGSNKNDLASPSPYMLKGYRVMFTDVMPKESAVDTFSLLFGNVYDAMLLGQRENVGIFASEHFRLDYDQLTIRGRTAYDLNFHEPGDVTNPGAMVGLKTAAA